ncbi:MAG: TPM domain-containing protein [Bacteroidales bacterium]|jgi:uncharacterized protein|nr:TPM domain-containing protein [Bacteroidales bacterium]
MKYHMEMIRKALFGLIFLLGIIGPDIVAQLPPPPHPPRLVVDRTSTLDLSQTNRLEEKLVAYFDTTSTQIAVVMLPDLAGYDISDLAFRIGESWGVGQKGFNNGIVIIVRPKTAKERGKAFIAVGYGLESLIPDAIAKRIVEKEMIPNFQQDRYYEGLDQATDIIIGLASGAYSKSNYQEQDGLTFLVVLLVMIFIIVIFSRLIGRGPTHMVSSSSPEMTVWKALWLASQAGRSHTGSWGGFSGGSGGFKGGFGGFGGGSFGGGGAGGSW